MGAKTALAFVALSFAACFGGYEIGRLDRRVAPLSCSIEALPTSVREDRVAAECGAPYTSNVYFLNGHQIDQWVYDAGTFLWFSDGTLQSYKLDERHAPEQASLAHRRDPMVFCY